MEQHPIPRQITTFEFKLIGFMTLTQFIYLIVFMPAAYVVFRIFPIPFLNVLLAFMVAMLGLALAFLPVNSRPLDVWIKNFYKRLMSPTQYYYHKHNPSLNYLSNLYFDQDPHKVEAHIQAQEKLSQYLSSRPTERADGEAVPLFFAALDQKRAQIASILQAPYDALMHHAPREKEQEEELEDKSEKLDDQPKELEGKHVDAKKDKHTLSEEDVKTDTADELTDTRDKEEATEETFTPIKKSDEGQKITDKLKELSDKPADSPGKEKPPLATPKKPFFAGVVKNVKKIPLPGILIYVKNTEGTPLRLLKSNPYGVFATYNALPSGTYTFEPRDPKGIFNFDTIKLTVNDTNEDPLELVSKELI